ncbi:hypothetical protein LCGC14_0980030 [marine sediment metagenome]|uniref:Uncharacterized protein n=1 Tax=marine sediment metagenome TaxID=412755 RepID=A0A0F9QSD3_9ZZZZ
MKQWEFEKLTKLNSLEDIEEIEKAMRKLDIEISILLEVHIRYEELKEMKLSNEDMNTILKKVKKIKMENIKNQLI